MKFFMTVGYQYKQTPHPQGLHPDGWVEIEAEDYDDAYQIAFLHYDSRWAFLYNEASFKRQYHPRGCIAQISRTTASSIVIAPEITFTVDRSIVDALRSRENDS
jgi:hypothetical protein